MIRIMSNNKNNNLEQKEVKFRGHIKSINVRSIRCHIHPQPLTSTDMGYHTSKQQSLASLFWNEKEHADEKGFIMEHEYENWVDEKYPARYAKATFKILPQEFEQVYNQAYNATNQDVILTVTPINNAIRNIQVVKQASKCHFCHKPKFTGVRKTWVAICCDRQEILYGGKGCSDWLTFRNNVLTTVDGHDFRGHLAYMCTDCPIMKTALDNKQYVSPLSMAEVRQKLRDSKRTTYVSSYSSYTATTPFVGVNLHGVRVIVEEGEGGEDGIMPIAGGGD